MSADEAQGNGGAQRARERRPRRTRNLKRVFVLLRSGEELRVPRAADLRVMAASGRVKELEFSRNHSCETIKELCTTASNNLLACPLSSKCKWRTFSIHNTCAPRSLQHIPEINVKCILLIFQCGVLQDGGEHQRPDASHSDGYPGGRGITENLLSK